ncbi:MAG: ABC transporter permease [Lachnospiraceae bacterium]|nr:ABC transporter permease [Lachnospiraceae bacterium]
MLNYTFIMEFISSILRMSTPLILVGMAAVIGAKANVLCVAYEGMMLCAALGGVLGSAYSHSLLVGVLCGMAGGIFIAAIFAYFVLYLDARPLLSGLALNTLANGGTLYLVYLLTGMKQNTSNLVSLKFPIVHIPVIENIPVLGGLVSGHNLMVYIAFISVVFVWFLINKTSLGIRIQAVGKNPDAAASVGVNVRKTKFIALLLSGILASFGGMYLSMGYLPYFTTDMAAGRGFIAIAAQNMGVGNPILTMIFSMIFGSAMAVGNVAQSYRLPSQFASMAPYLLTIISMWIMGIRTRKKRLKAGRAGL